MVSQRVRRANAFTVNTAARASPYRRVFRGSFFLFDPRNCFSDFFSKEIQMFDKILQGFIRRLAAAIVEGERAARPASPKVPDIRQRRRVAGKVVQLGAGDFSADYSRDNCPSGVRWTEPPASGK
jgi:hypothetical protein